MTRKELGKIKSVRVGFGGYQDVMFGVWFELGGETWSVGDGKGTWAHWSEGRKWTPSDQADLFAETMRYMITLCEQAKIDNVAHLVGVPIEIEFDGNLLKSWRVLKEVL